MTEQHIGKVGGGDGKANDQPSGSTGDHPATSGKEQTKVTSAVPEKAIEQINPSSPADTGTTPGSNAEVG